MMFQHEDSSQPQSRLNRRALLKSAVGVGAGALVASGATPAKADGPSARPELKGNINQSICHWCFKDHWSVDELCRTAAWLGCRSIELVPPQHWPTLKKYKLECAIASSHGFVRGPNDPANWDFCLETLRKRIDECADAGVKNVITFTGMRGEIPDDVGQKNCVEAFKKIIGHAEEKKVTLCLEMLNTRDASHPMKGHPGYQGDHLDYCMEIINQVGSPRMKLLFDIYHVQIMDGDVIRRIRQLGDAIGHIHTAGNPGRGELDNTQEINYPPIMQALVEVGYKGFVGHEFIPTRNPLEGLKEAVVLCDV